MKGNITIPTSQSVDDFLAQFEGQQLQDSKKLVEIMHDISGEPPVMWGTSIIGFGTYTYKYASGREGDWMKIGFSPRKGKISLYLTTNASNFKSELDAMGKHAVGKGCIYINKLADVDIDKLKHIIKVAYE